MMNKFFAIALNADLLEDVSPINRKSWRILKEVFSEFHDELELLRWSEENLISEEIEKVRAVVERQEEIEAILRDWRNAGVTAISEFDEEYPNRWHEVLGEKKPSVLFVAGNVKLLQRESIGVVGSRDVDTEGGDFASEVASVSVRNGYAVVSGGAKGVDAIVMRSAFQEGGDVIGFLPDSLLKVVQSRDFREVMDSGKAVLASAVSPLAPFNVGNAMARNKLVYGHAIATVVASSSDGSGGTWAGATEAIKHGYGIVLVRDGDNVPDGNKRLIELGGVAVADVEMVMKAIKERAKPEGLAKQGRLF